MNWFEIKDSDGVINRVEGNDLIVSPDGTLVVVGEPDDQDESFVLFQANVTGWVWWKPVTSDG